METLEDSRLYHRFVINNPRLCFISQNNIPLGIVQELSYGGFSLVPFPQQAGNLKLLSRKTAGDLNPTVQITFLDRSITCQIEERYRSQEKIGYQLSHEQTEILSFLKEIIPWIRSGAALGRLQKLEKEGFPGELPDYLSFDGPIPVEIDWEGQASDKTPNFSIVLKQDKILYQLVRKNDRLVTGHNVWPGAESGDIRPTRLIDPIICRWSLAVLLGLASESGEGIYSILINRVLDLYPSIPSENQRHLKVKTG